MYCLLMHLVMCRCVCYLSLCQQLIIHVTICSHFCNYESCIYHAFLWYLTLKFLWISCWFPFVPSFPNFIHIMGKKATILLFNCITYSLEAPSCDSLKLCLWYKLAFYQYDPSQLWFLYTISNICWEKKKSELDKLKD